jgi:hypothetical protein
VRVGAPPLRQRGVGRDFLTSAVRPHATLIWLIALYCVAAVCFRLYFSDANTPDFLIFLLFFGSMSALFCLAFVVAYPVYVMLVLRPNRLFVHIWQGLRYQYLIPERLASGFVVLITMPIFIWSFTTFKTLIPAINPYDWDVRLAAADRALHGGVDAWVLLDPVLGSPLVTSGINFLYNLWFFVLFSILFWQAFSLKDTALRLQFLLTFVVLWIVMGTVWATMMSSVGPVYYGRTTGLDDIYAPLMRYLYSVRETFPVWSLATQEALWRAYENGESGLVSGISAMPSMHVATTVLFALLGWRHHRLLAWVLILFALLILLGSVHLGWHYALDGYVAIPVVWGIWRLSGIYVASRE